ncbi:RDD family protein [Halocola ammonii]
MESTETFYPGVSDRVKAVFTDSFMVVLMIIATTLLFEAFEIETVKPRIYALVFIFFLYDPIFTSLFGGTIGHMTMKIRVKRLNNQNKNIIFPLALIRFLVKTLLGIVSLLTVSGNKKARAIHDMASGSVVVYKE